MLDWLLLRLAVGWRRCVETFWYAVDSAKECDMGTKSFMDMLRALGTSRKFWLFLIGAVVGIVLFVQGSIEADALADALVKLVGVIVGAIAIEDGFSRMGKG